jgi:hypothetical protein
MMASTITVQLVSYGDDSDRVPVLVEILDAELELRYSKWIGAKSEQSFTVQPGIWGVRARIASGAIVEKVVEAEDGRDVECSLSLHQLSPHETNEWAYYTQPIALSEKRTFLTARYRNAWIRLWSLAPEAFGRREWGAA